MDVLRRRFTLIEMLTVIAILAILIAMLLPVLARAKRNALRTVCISNQREFASALLFYANDYSGSFPGDKSIYFDQGPHTSCVQGYGGCNPMFIYNWFRDLMMTDYGMTKELFYSPSNPQRVAGYWDGLAWPGKGTPCNVSGMGFELFTNLEPVGGIVGGMEMPTTVMTSEPDMVLLADQVQKYVFGGANIWNATSTQWGPRHSHADNSGFPYGGHRALVDGTVIWLPFDQYDLGKYVRPSNNDWWEYYAWR